MTLLALYWSIMIACYLLASRLRKYAEKFKFVDKLMSLSVYALVLLMGLRMGADEEVTSSLGSIGIQALFVTVLTAAGSMLGAFAVRKLLHIDRHAHPAGAVINDAETVHEKADVSGAKMSFIILLMVVVGMLLGDLVIRRVCTDLPAFQSRSGDYLVVGLCIMLGLIGFSMGLDGSIARILRNAGLGVILVPIFAVLGTLLGGAVYAALSPMTLREGLAISAGFGWYTMAPSVIASAGTRWRARSRFCTMCCARCSASFCCPSSRARSAISRPSPSLAPPRLTYACRSSSRCAARKRSPTRSVPAC
ncbi:MAG: LysO family transporter [Eubacteriales bacterium]